MSSWGGGEWLNGSGNVTWFPTTITTSGTNLLAYPAQMRYAHPQPLPSVMASIEAPLSDLEWLDAQISEVCELAAAA